MSRSLVQSILKRFGYELLKRPSAMPEVEDLPAPDPALVRRAEEIFANTFDLAPGAPERAAIERRVGDFYWHYPFRFGDVEVECDHPAGRGLTGRHYRRYLHIFPALLALTDGGLDGLSVLDIACNAGFWSIQARRAGADRVLGVEASEQNVEQARFIGELIGLDRVEYRVLNVYDLGPDTAGTHDVTFMLGLLYHLDNPMAALARLHEVTGRLAVVDTTLTPADIPVVRLMADHIHDQNWSNELALLPSARAVVMMLRHAGFREVHRVPITTPDMPDDYRDGRRATFIARR
ncbi:MAG: class I SAM-dependent methyltransferase [Planctomycetota bacterium]|jgi:2-polyprenyl-3-methyl-5-hydroxy-6-metoxy-1,4-benzoquinol methylase